jgi:hypothetical protein
MNKKRNSKAEEAFKKFDKKYMDDGFSILAFLMAITWLPMIIYDIIKKIVTGEDPPYSPPSSRGG